MDRVHGREPQKVEYTVRPENLATQEIRNARIKVQSETMRDLLEDYPDLLALGEAYNRFTDICRDITNDDLTLLPRFIDPATHDAALAEIVSKVKRGLRSRDDSATPESHVN